MERYARLSALANGFGSPGKRSPEIRERQKKAPLKAGPGLLQIISL